MNTNRMALVERLRNSMHRIGKMCGDGTPPRMSIPVRQDDDDVFICNAIKDAIAALQASEGAALMAEAVQIEPDVDISTGWANDCVKLQAEINRLTDEIANMSAEKDIHEQAIDLRNAEINRLLALRAVQVEPVAISANDVNRAIYAVDVEACRRGKMFPQTFDEQREDRRAVSRVMAMISWYEKNTGCANIEGWPSVATPQEPAVNAELLAALKAMFLASDPSISGSPDSPLEKARAAIANATSQALYAAPQEAESVGASIAVAIEKHV